MMHDQSDRQYKGSEPDDRTLSQRQAVKRLVLWFMLLIIVGFLALITAQASEINERQNTDSVSPQALFDFLSVVKFLSGVGIMYGVQKLTARKPTVDTELAVSQERQQHQPTAADMAEIQGRLEAYETRLAAVEGGQRLIFKKLDLIIESSSGLREGQAKNTANIDDIKSTVHLMQTQTQALHTQIFAISQHGRPK